MFAPSRKIVRVSPPATPEQMYPFQLPLPKNPVRLLIRHFLTVPQRREYYPARGNDRYRPTEIENPARQYGIGSPGSR
jgi:hypothetical protein